jgi:disulfide bond formation protein DsbB
MSFSTMNSAFAVLALVVNATVLLIASGFVATRFSPTGRAAWRRLRDQITPAALAFAWIVAVFCTCASLFLQFGEHLDPCDLCWFQRICMYPQALILGIAVLIGDRYMVKRYMIPLACVGSVISVIHINLPNLMQLFNLPTFPGCSLSEPCSAQPITEFGFITIPYMALSGFLLIVTMLLLVRDREYDANVDHSG